MNTEPEEYALALQARDGDPGALAELVERTRVRLFALAYAELRHYEDAHDAVAAALLRVCRHIRELQEPESVRAWMQSIVRNEVRRLRRSPGAPMLSLEEGDGHTDDPSRFLLRLDIERALRQLPGEQERAIRLFYLDDLSISDIARRVGRPAGTIKSWLHRGRQHLAQQMEAYAPMTATPTPTPTLSAALIHSNLDPATVKKVTSALKTGGYRTKVLTPTDPSLLLDSVENDQVIVLDEWINGRSALEYILNMKARPEVRDIAVCLLAADPGDFAVSAYFTAGVRRLVNKNDPAEIAKLAGPFDEPKPGCWSRFTERARRVVYFAQDEAASRGTNLVASEYLLLGLIREGDSVAGRVLSRLGVSPDQIRTAVEKQLVPLGRMGQEMLLTPDAKQVIDLANEEAERLKLDYIGTEHLLVGLIRAGGRAGRALAEVGVDRDRTRREVAMLLEAEPPPAPLPTGADVAGAATRCFTERTRRVLLDAHEEAAWFKESFIGTEHLLMGVLREPDSAGARLLVRVGISPESTRAEILQQATTGSGSEGEILPLTPRARQVIDLAWEEARQLNRNYIGTEHLVLGMLREGDGLAARVLTQLGADLERLRVEVQAMGENETQP